MSTWYVASKALTVLSLLLWFQSKSNSFKTNSLKYNINSTKGGWDHVEVEKIIIVYSSLTCSFPNLQLVGLLACFNYSKLAKQHDLNSLFNNIISSINPTNTFTPVIHN